MRASARPAGSVLAFAVLAFGTLTGCFRFVGSEGGGQTAFEPPRSVDPADVALLDGYRIEAVATGLTFPTGVAFDGEGRPHVVESGYAYGEEWTVPRLLRVEPDGSTSVLAEGGNPPWNGVAFGGGAFFVAEGGQSGGGRILRIGPDGERSVLVDGLPGLGDHHTNGPAVGPDGMIYFGQGTATNSGVVGLDNAAFGWLHRHPDFHDIPCEDVVSAGRSFETPNPLQGGSGPVRTGAFSPFGTEAAEGEVIPGRVPCSGSVLRIPPDGGPLELVAWGFRNPFGLAFDARGGLWVTDNSFDVRGSRPVHGAGDLLWRVRPGAWYGWPDFHGERPLSDEDHFRPPGGPAPGFVLSEHPGRPPRPAAILAVHSSSNGLDFSRNPAFGFVGDAFVAQFGDIAPASGRVMAPVGFKVVRVDVESGVVRDVAVNRAPPGPASATGGGGLERPVAVRFSPDGRALYVVDFGVMTADERGPRPHAETGVLWRITPEEDR